MNWQKLLLVGIGWGIGTAVGLAVLAGGFLWYESRPKPPLPPKPWNNSAIVAEYDFVDTEGDQNTCVFYYTVENKTDFDYRIEDGHDILMSARLVQDKNLSPFTEGQKVDYPVFVPAKKRVRFKIHIDYTCPIKENNSDQIDNIKKHRVAVAKYVTNTFQNLEGFDLLDETNRYEVVFRAAGANRSREASVWRTHSGL
jgi:hypothetical protein